MKYGVTGFDDIMPGSDFGLNDQPIKEKPLELQPVETVHAVNTLQPANVTSEGNKKLFLYIGVVAALLLIIVFTNKKQ